MWWVGWCALLMFALPVAAIADPVTANFGALVDLDAARHAIDGQPETFVAPLPFFTTEFGDRRFSIEAETLSTFGTLRFGDQATSLNILIASARVKLGGGFFAGVGSTVLNQSTTFDPAIFYAGLTDNLVERSRVTGARYELGYERGRWSIVVGASPAMHGVVNDHCVEVDAVLLTGPCVEEGYSTIDLAVPERASEVDTYARYYLPLRKHVDVMAGFRYLNFIGHITYPNQTDTDQNRGAPLISLGVRVHTR